jgi:hypothetical protein
MVSTASLDFDSVPEFIDPFFAKTSPKRSFSVLENKRFELDFEKTGSINSGSGHNKEMSSVLADQERPRI